MVDAGHLALVTAFVVTLYVVAASFVGALRRVPELSTSGRYGLYTVPVLLGVSTFVLVQAFVRNDFSVRYVAENSSLSMPKAYTWVAMYAGNAGSLLFIALVLSVLTVAAVLTLRRQLPYTAPYATALMAAFMAFFLGVMLFLADPLERLPIVPEDGQGINPLLVHFGMFIHPPLQMTGLVSVTIPFSIVMGAMLARRGGRDEWVDVGRLWGMLSWLIMTAGLMLGAWWAYTILGWGGYWAWDPVENSALMPWLAMTAFVHSIMVQKRRGMFRMWNIVLIVVAFTLAQMGMFINRGGPVPSVHSFAQSAMGWIFLSFMVGTLAGSMAAFVWRMDTLKSRERLDSFLSRESAFLVQNVLFLLVAFVTLWGTVFPVFSEAAQGTTVTVGRPFFDRVNGPLLLALIALMGVGPLLPWRRATPRILFAVTRVPVGAGLLTAAVLAVFGVRDPVALLAFAVCGVAAAGILHEWARGTRSRHDGRGEAYPVAFGRLLLANRPRYGGYIVHIGIVMLTAGAVGSSFFGVQRDVALRPGEEASFGGYTFRYLSHDVSLHPDRREEAADVELRAGERFLGVVRPFRAVYPDFNIASTRGAIRSTPVEDFYIVPSEFGEDGQAVFRVMVNPMVWWMWASGPILALGVLFALSPQRQPSPAALRVPVFAETSRA